MRSQIFRQIAQKFRRHTVCMARDFWVIWRKICTQITCKAVRRALCSVSWSVSRIFAACCKKHVKGIQKFQGSTAQGFYTRCPWYISRHACIYCAWGDLCGIFQFADTAAAEQFFQTVSVVPAGGNSATAARTQSIYPHPTGTPAACGIFAASPKALFSVALRYWAGYKKSLSVVQADRDSFLKNFSRGCWHYNDMRILWGDFSPF